MATAGARLLAQASRCGGAVVRVLVCGGRHYQDAGHVWSELDTIHNLSGPITCLIVGGAFGVDTLAEAWAVREGVPVDRYPAQWETYGKSAGPMRNRQMLVDGKPDLVVAFPGGAGTNNMVKQARAAGVPVERPTTARLEEHLGFQKGDG